MTAPLMTCSKIDSANSEDFAKVMASPEQVLGSSRISLNPDDVKNGLGRLVLTLVELLRELLERQAIRRVEAGSLNDDEVERLGTTFLQLSEQMERLKTEFGVTDEDLNIDLGPLGKLLSPAPRSDHSENLEKRPMARNAVQHSVSGSSLADILERVLDKGVVIAGDIKIKLVDIELLTIQIRLVIASVDKAREMGMDWWLRNPDLSSSKLGESDSKLVSQLEDRINRLEAELAATRAEKILPQSASVSQ